MWILAQAVEETEVTGTTLSDLFLPFAFLLFLILLWFGMIVVIARRARERRRRKEQGLEPLPGFWTQIAQALSGSADKPEKPQAPKPAVAPAANPLLSEDLLPNLDDLAPSPAPPIQPPPAPPTPPQATTMAADIQQPSPPTARQKLSSDILERDAVEELQVWRSLVDGKLIFKMRGNIFREAQDLAGTADAGRFSKLLAEIMPDASPKPSVPTPAPAAPPRPAPSPKPAPSLQPLKPPPQPANTDNSMGIADQIELFLQARLTAFPNLAAQEIHVHPTADGGVRIQVGSQYYEAVSDIPETDIREFLQQTIQAWSEQH